MFKSIPMSKITYYHPIFLSEMRQIMDPLADHVVQAIYTSENPKQLRGLLGMFERNSDRLPEGLPEEVETFLKVSGQLPSWANEKKMRQGAEFFSKYGGDLMMMLGLLSLPYDYAAAHGAQVLYLSQRLHGNPGKRLLETGEYIVNVTARNAFTSRGKAICSAQKVRLIHATIRYHILKDNVWQGQVWGQPINQEDMAGTNLSVALLPIRGLRKLGLRIKHDDMMAYLHLWNVASFIMGVDARLLPDTAKEAYVLEKMIAARQHAPSEAGQSLTKSLINYIQQQAGPKLSALAPVYMRYLLGDQIADWLDIPPGQIPEKLVIRTAKGGNFIRSLAPFNQNPSMWNSFKQKTRNGINADASKFIMPPSLTS